jgi:hypothetical protein
MVFASALSAWLQRRDFPFASPRMEVALMGDPQCGKADGLG